MRLEVSKPKWCHISRVYDSPCISPSRNWCKFGVRDPIPMTDVFGRAILEDGRFKIFYNGRSGPLSEGGITRVGRATCSSDMEDWTVDNNYLFEDGVYAAAGSVLKIDASNYWLFYSCGTDIGLCRATSNDGLKWHPDNTIILKPSDFSCSRIGLPVVTQHNGQWIMLLEGIRDGSFRIFLAHSDDGKNWSPSLEGEPLLSPAPTGWDGQSQANPSISPVTQTGDTESSVLFYNAYSQSNLGAWDLGAVLFKDEPITATVKPILTRQELPWSSKRLEGTRLLSTPETDRILFFSLPSNDSYMKGEIYMADLRWTDEITEVTKTSAEEEANDSLSKKYFAIWDNYPIQVLTQRIETSWLKKLIAPGDHVLVAGSGGGREIDAFLETAGRIVALDISAEMLAVGQARFSEANIEWYKGDISSPPSNLGKFDRILALGGVFAYLPDPELAFQNLSKLLNPDGRLIISTMNSEHPSEENETKHYNDGRIRRPMSLDMIRTLAQTAGMSIVDVQGLRFLVDLLPNEWNTNGELSGSEKEILDAICAIESKLIEAMPPEKAKFLWVTAGLTNLVTPEIPIKTQKPIAVRETKPTSNNTSLSARAARCLESLVSRFEALQGVSADQYTTKQVYHPMAEGKYLQILAHWRKAQWISGAWLAGRVKKSVKRLEQYILSKDSTTAAWGINFSYKQAPPDEPYLITTAIIALGLLRIAPNVDSVDCVVLRNKALKWLNSWMRQNSRLYNTDAPPELPSFSPHVEEKVYNAAAYGAYVLQEASAHNLFEPRENLDVKLFADNLIKSIWFKRVPGVGWPYTDSNFAIDLVHQCYILFSLHNTVEPNEWEKQAIATFALLFEGNAYVDKFSLASNEEAMSQQVRAKKSYLKVIGEYNLIYPNKPARLWSLGEFLLVAATQAKHSAANRYWSVISLKCMEQILLIYAENQHQTDLRQDMHVAHGISAWLSLNDTKPKPKNLQ